MKINVDMRDFHTCTFTHILMNASRKYKTTLGQGSMIYRAARAIGRRPIDKSLFGVI